MKTNFSYLLLSLLFILSLTIQSCKDDDPAPKFSFPSAEIDVTNYFGGGTLVLHYSTDGTNFTATVPQNLKNTAVVTVKVYDGAHYLTAETVSFDWSASSPQPDNVNADIAQFTINKSNINVRVAVASKLKVEAANINTTNYTAGGEVSLRYSVDNGVTYTTTPPQALKKHDVVKVKLTNGTVDVLSNHFNVDWSASTTLPADASADIASFTVGEQDITINVTVSDKLVLIAAHRTSGIFYSLNKVTGEKTEIFTVTLDGTTLANLRSFAYNHHNGQYYAGAITNGGGKLYSINASTKEATVINTNDNGSGSTKWDGLAGLVISPDNTIIATGWASGQSLITFTASGVDSSPVPLTNAEVCCGMGLTYGSSYDELLIGDYSNTGLAKLHKSPLTGIISETLALTLTGFETDYSASDIYIRSLTKDENGTVYGLLYVSNTGGTMLVSIDLSNSTMSYIATVGATNTDQYFSFTSIPAYLL